MKKTFFLIRYVIFSLQLHSVKSFLAFRIFSDGIDEKIFVLIWTVFDVCVIDMWLSSRFDCICYGGWRWGILFHVTIPLGNSKLALHSISVVASERKVKRPSVSTYLTQDSLEMKRSFVCTFCMIENISI